MEINKQQIEDYIEKLFEKRKVIQDKFTTSTQGVNLNSTSKKEKLIVGGLKVLAIEVDAEILSTIDFINSIIDIPIVFSENIQTQIDQLKTSKVNLLAIQSGEIKFPDNIEEFLKDKLN